MFWELFDEPAENRLSKHCSDITSDSRPPVLDPSVPEANASHKTSIQIYTNRIFWLFFHRIFWLFFHRIFWLFFHRIF